MVTFTNENQNINVNDTMLPLWTHSYSKFVIKILKKSLRHSLSIYIFNLEFLSNEQVMAAMSHCF